MLEGCSRRGARGRTALADSIALVAARKPGAGIAYNSRLIYSPGYVDDSGKTDHRARFRERSRLTGRLRGRRHSRSGRVVPSRSPAPQWRTVKRLIPDEQPVIEETLRALVDEERCHLVLTTGGTGPAWRDVTPEATLAVADKVMPGFGEQMRQVSLKFVPTAILSRQVAVIRKQALIINLPGQPKAIRETLEGLKDDTGKSIVSGIFAAVPYCIDLIGGPYIETNEDVVKAFRPKSAIRPKTNNMTRQVAGCASKSKPARARARA